MSRAFSLIVASVCATSAFAPTVFAGTDADVESQINELRNQISAQQQMLSAQQQKLLELENKMRDRPVARPVQGLDAIRGTGPGPSNATQAQAGQQPQGPVGQPEQKERPQVSAISDVGGVLTPRGTLTVEPTFEYDNSQVNRFFFAGTEIVNAVFIGGLEATNSRQNTLIAGVNGRYGITNRLEASVRVPYVYRFDRTNTPPSDTLVNSVYGNDIGDVEAGLHYQINQPTGGGAYYVANFRVKSDTGTGPFSVPFNAIGQQTTLPTGSGGWAIEPSITVLYPNDPVVLYGNIGYAKSFAYDPNVNIPALGGLVSEVQPGDALRGTFGMGFAINDRISMSLGYEHDWVQSTTTTINGIKSASEELQVGSLNLGVSYALTPRIAINSTVSIGATRDAPDARLMLSVPINFDVAR